MSIIFAASPAGGAESEFEFTLGGSDVQIPAGRVSDTEDIYIRNSDATKTLMNSTLYLAAVASGTYVSLGGSGTPDDDLETVLAWGDYSNSSALAVYDGQVPNSKIHSKVDMAGVAAYGYLLNMQTGASESDAFFPMGTDYGGSQENGVLLLHNTGGSTQDGYISAGEESHIQMKMAPPSTANDGKYVVGLVLRYEVTT